MKFSFCIACVFLAAISFPSVEGQSWWQERSQITYSSNELTPEGIEFESRTGKFLVSSWLNGGVHIINDDKSVTVFAEPIPGFGSSGIKIHKEMIAVASLKWPSTPEVGVAFYERDTGALIQFVDLTQVGNPLTPGLINDITFDSDDNLYATDTLGASVYKIDANFNASVFATDERMAPLEGGFGQNGIVTIPSKDSGVGEAILINWLGLPEDPTTQSRYFVIPLKTQNVTQLIIEGDNIEPFYMADGLLYDEETKTLINTAPFGVYFFTSDDKFETAVQFEYITDVTNPCGGIASAVLNDGELFATCWGDFYFPGPYNIQRISREYGLSAGSNLLVSFSMLCITFLAVFVQ